MPRMDGLAAARAIQSGGGPSARSPIIAMSADVMTRNLEQCRQAGMVDHIAKPIQLAVMHAVLPEQAVVVCSSSLEVAAGREILEQAQVEVCRSLLAETHSPWREAASSCELGQQGQEVQAAISPLLPARPPAAPQVVSSSPMAHRSLSSLQMA
jgi:CheY-like chemotaxis protein